MNSKTIEKAFWLIGIILIIGLIVSIIRRLNKAAETKVISDEGFAALQNPAIKKKIDDAILNAKKKQIETGIWEDPVVNL